MRPKDVPDAALHVTAEEVTTAVETHRIKLWWDGHPADYPRWAEQHGWPKRFLDAPFAGVTTNPRLIAASLGASRSVGGPRTAETDVYAEVIIDAANSVRSRWEETDGREGVLCGQVPPPLLTNASDIVRWGRHMARRAPNLLIKVPGSAVGYDAMEVLMSEGIQVNSTLSFGVPQLQSFMTRVNNAGSAELRKADRFSIFTVMLGRIFGAGRLERSAACRGVEVVPGDADWARVALVHKVYTLASQEGMVRVLLSSLPGRATPSVFAPWTLPATIAPGMIYTCNADSLAPVSASIVRADAQVDLVVPDSVMGRLLDVPYFRRFYLHDGVSEVQFDDLSVFKAAIEEGEDAWQLIRSMSR